MNMFGKNDELDGIRTALAAMECDMSAFRGWQKQYERVKRQYAVVQQRYESARQILQTVEKDVLCMEKILTEQMAPDKKAFAQFLRELKRLQNSFDHEFLISREDQEFHSTYDTILKLGVKALETLSDRIILQSEIENLLALLRENLEKEPPNMAELSFFYLNRTDQELSELPPADRLKKISEVYAEEFFEPVVHMVENAIVRADERRTVLGENADRMSQKLLNEIEALPKQTVEGMTARERAVRLLLDVLEV